MSAAYIALSLTAVGLFDLAYIFPEDWAPIEKNVGSGFLIGVIVQGILVLIAAYLVGLVDLRRAISNTFQRATRKAWTIAAIAAAIHIATALLVFIPQPQRAWEASSVNIMLSAIPAVDGWTQEVLFRGYVLLRLARSGVPGTAQVLISGGLFAAIHIGYAGAGGGATLAPLLGTFMLGSVFAWSVQAGRGSLTPVVVCHILIIVITQPWLALAR